MAFEDLQQAFIEAELEKLKGKDAAPKPAGKAKLAKSKNATKGKKRIDAAKKHALTKELDKSKEKKELQKQREKAEKTTGEAAGQKEAKPPEKAVDKAQQSSNPSASYGADMDAQVDLSIYRQKFYLPEDKNRVSGLDQLEAINKLPVPEERVTPEKETKQPTQDKQASAGDRFRQLREVLGGGGGIAKGSIAPPKTPITAEAKAAKATAAKESELSMNALLALHSNKSS